MVNDRVKELLEYLNVLSQVQGSGHYVNEEIKEVVKEIRLELGLEKRKQDTLKNSRRLVFEAKLGHPATYRQMTLFESVYGAREKELLVLFLEDEIQDMEKAIEVLKGMNKEVSLKFAEESFAVEVSRK